jgi:hypothetical protein
MGYEPTIRLIERAKTFHALDGAATVIGYNTLMGNKFSCQRYHERPFSPFPLKTVSRWFTFILN